MQRALSAALLGGVMSVLAVAGGISAMAADPQVEAELSRLIAGYAASGQEQMDRLSEAQQQTLAGCAAEALGELPQDDMAVLTAGEDLEAVIDVLGERLEDRAGMAAAEQLEDCFDTAMDAAEAPDQGGAAAPAGSLDAEYVATLETMLRESDPPSEEAVAGVVRCMTQTLLPVLTEAEKRETIDTRFSEEIGMELSQAHPAEFDAFMACSQELVAEHE